jgi:uncharacterized protein YndB with AHSA1/START domain
VSEQTDYLVEIERTYAASAEAVFDAWTSPEVMRRWFHCGHDWDTPVAEVDLRVGGAVRIVMRRPTGSEHEARGEYMQIERPRRLLMKWMFGEEPANEQLIELTFSESDGATTVRMLNTGISTEARRASQDEGWNGCLEELGRLLAAE